MQKKEGVARTPSGRVSRAKDGAKKGGSKPHGDVAVSSSLRMRVTAAEAAAVEAAARDAEVSVSAWLRAAVEEALDQASMRRWRGP